MCFWVVIVGLYLSSSEQFKHIYFIFKYIGYGLAVFHFLIFFFTQLRTFLIVKNDDCTLIKRSGYDNPYYSGNLERTLDLKYSLCQICLERGINF